MNLSAMFSSQTDMWETPQPLFDELDREFYFTLDACAVRENAKCRHYFTPEEDGLKQDWPRGGVIYMNPPYGRTIGKWVKKAAESGATVVCLLPARTDTAWFHNYIYGKTEVRFLRGRLKFGRAKCGAPFPSMVVIFRGGGQ